jgi:phosphoglycerate dehydrogenase-like enzyme
MKPRCLFVMDPQFFPLLFGPAERACLNQLVQAPHEPMSAAEFESAGTPLADVEFIIGSWGMPVMSETLLTRMPRLQAIFYAAGTVKSVVSEAVWTRGIRVTNASWVNALPTAEFAFAAIIFSLKRAWSSMALLKRHRTFERYTTAVPGTFGSTVGLLSLGKVGRHVAERLATLDVKVIGYDPFVPESEAQELGVTLGSLEEVFATADVVSCHMPLTEETQRSLGHELFASMKSGATFINTARGTIVRESELIAVLTARPDLFAVLDVMEAEPPRPNCPLLQLPNVVATPHIAGSVGMECRRMGMMMVDELERFLARQPLKGEVLRAQLETLA